MTPFFTPDEIKQIEAIPRESMQALIIQMVAQAKAILFQVISERTGAMPPPDYMLTHASEFANAAIVENHHAIAVWSWKGEPIVKQTMRLVAANGKLDGNMQTRRM